MILCKHQPHRVIDDIKDPKWSTDEILISVHKISPNIEHYIISFSNPSPQKKYGWFYMAGKDIRKCRTQANGRGTVYAVPMDKRQEFIANNKCEHSQ